MAGADGAAVFQTCRKHSKLVAEHFPHVAANPQPTNSLVLLRFSFFKHFFFFCILCSFNLGRVSEP